MDISTRNLRNLFHCSQKRRFVRFRRFVEAADLPYELKRSGPNFIAGDGGIEVEECPDIPAHLVMPKLTNLNAASHWPSKIEYGSTAGTALLFVVVMVFWFER